MEFYAGRKQKLVMRLFSHVQIIYTSFIIIVRTCFVDKGIDLYIVVALIGLDSKVVSFSGLSILDRPFDFLKHLSVVRQIN